MERYVIMKFRHGAAAQFLEIFEENKHKIAAFAGCTHLELRRSAKHSNWFMTFSLWDDEKYLNLYRNSELFKAVWGRVKPLFESEPEALSVWPEKAGETEKRNNFLERF